jgi:hypothetical protein
MKLTSIRLTSLVLVFALIFSGCSSALIKSHLSLSTSPTLPETSVNAAESNQDSASLSQAFGQMPLLFIQNQGQLDSQVAYYLQGKDTSIYFTPEGLTFALTAPSTETTFTAFEKNPKNQENPPAKTSRWVLKLDFVGANPGVIPQGEEQAETVVSYFKGSRDEWHAGLPTFHRLVYHNLWEGIDLGYSGTTDRLKYEFVVQPGADPGQIRLAYRGAIGLELDANGQMEISTQFGNLQDAAPVAYQVSGDVQVAVAASYTIQEPDQQHVSGKDASATEIVFAYSFQVADYDPTLPLIIDPAMLVYCGFIGGSTADGGTSIAVDGKGAAYITGGTSSDQTTFPVTVGPDLTYTFEGDAFVAKVLPDGSRLLYAGYIGGGGADMGSGIAVDGSGAAYITGETESPQTSFPVSGGPDLVYNGSRDAFVAKVSPDGTGLIYAGYIGGNNDDRSFGIAVDGSRAVYVTGYTKSDETTFPISIGPDLTYNGGNFEDTFVAKVRPDGTELIYAGYIGGSLDDSGRSIAVDGSGAAYITGYSGSNETSFPVSVGPDLIYNGGTNDAFVAKVKPDGTGLVYCGYVGGSGEDQGYSIAVDSIGAVYVTGWTSSYHTSFPATIGPDLTYNSAYGGDAFVAKLKPDGTGLAYAGYIGGSWDERRAYIAVDGGGAAYVAGYTGSGQDSFPVSGGPDLTFNGGTNDAFVAKVRPDGTGLEYAGYIGGSNDDRGYGIAVDGSGAIYITGSTESDQTSFPVILGPDLTYNSNSDAFVAKIAGPILDKMVYLPAIIK